MNGSLARSRVARLGLFQCRMVLPTGVGLQRHIAKLASKAKKKAAQLESLY
jgi:hypothetical protein